MGIHTRIGTGGVRPARLVCRRLAVARALYQSAPVVIVDDRGLASDSIARGLIDAAWMSGDAGATAIFILDELVRMERFDRVLVMSQGRVIESGHHTALMAGGGVYARLQAMQRDSAPTAREILARAC